VICYGQPVIPSCGRHAGSAQGSANLLPQPLVVGAPGENLLSEDGAASHKKRIDLLGRSMKRRMNVWFCLFATEAEGPETIRLGR
jgi:hypothetical protein